MPGSLASRASSRSGIVSVMKMVPIPAKIITQTLLTGRMPS
jgi:hypothetical protein